MIYDNGSSDNPNVRQNMQNAQRPMLGNVSPSSQNISLFHAPEATPRNLPTQPGWGIQPGVSGDQIMNMNSPKYQPPMSQGAIQYQNDGVTPPNGPLDARWRGNHFPGQGTAPIDPERRGSGPEGLPNMQDPWSGKFGSLGNNAWGANGVYQGMLRPSPTAPFNPNPYGMPRTNWGTTPTPMPMGNPGSAPINPERYGGLPPRPEGGPPPMEDPWLGKMPGGDGGSAEGLPPIHDPVGGGLGKPTIFGPPAAQPGQTNPWLQHYLAQTRSF